MYHRLEAPVKGLYQASYIGENHLQSHPPLRAGEEKILHIHYEQGIDCISRQWQWVQGSPLQIDI